MWVPHAAAVDTLDIGLLESPPWSYQNEQGDIEGIYIDLFREIEGNLKGAIKLNVKLYPLARVLLQVKSGVEIAVMSYRPERERLMHPLHPLYRTPFVLISLEGSGIHSLNDLEGRSVAMLIGGSECPCLDDKIPYKKIKLNQHIQGIRMLFNDRVDAVAGPAIRLYGRIEELNVKQSLAPDITYERRTVWIWAARHIQKSKKVMLFKKQVERILATGKFRALATEHLSPTQTKYLYDLSPDHR